MLSCRRPGVGDLGTHAFNLAGFVTGLTPESVSADLHTFVDGRRLDDNGHILLRYRDGARGMIWTSQVAPGNENALRLRIYGAEGGLDWAQENPNRLIHTPLGEQPRVLTRSGPGLGDAASRASRIPPGHPEGYLEGFAQLYADLALQIDAHRAGREPDPAALLVPTVADGLAGARFVDAVVRSSRDDGAWRAL